MVWRTFFCLEPICGVGLSAGTVQRRSWENLPGERLIQNQMELESEL